MNLINTNDGDDGVQLDLQGLLDFWRLQPVAPVAIGPGEPVMPRKSFKIIILYADPLPMICRIRQVTSRLAHDSILAIAIICVECAGRAIA
jgi:hypothetical protein